MGNKVIIKNPNIASTIADGNCVLVPLVNNMADMQVIHTLNEVGSFIWNSIDNNKNIDDYVKLVSEEFNVLEEIAKNDIMTFFAELEKKSIISFRN